jgi:hypothetical protein
VEVLFGIPMTPFLGVQSRCIRGQPFQHHPKMCRHILLDDHGAMRIQPIPDDDHRAGDVPLQMLQSLQYLHTPNGMLKVALVELARKRQANDRRQLAALTHAPQHGCLPLWSPGGTCLGAKRTPGLIDEDDFRTSMTSLFLMRGQSWVSQAWTNAPSQNLPAGLPGSIPPAGAAIGRWSGAADVPALVCSANFGDHPSCAGAAWPKYSQPRD